MGVRNMIAQFSKKPNTPLPLVQPPRYETVNNSLWRLNKFGSNSNANSVLSARNRSVKNNHNRSNVPKSRKASRRSHRRSTRRSRRS